MKRNLFLSLGSNIEPRNDYLNQARLLLNEKFKFVTASSVYETAPLLDLNQNSFYNQILFYKTDIIDPFEVLKITKFIENDLGRIKDIERPKGPRVIDIDIIFFGDMKVEDERLSIPHKSYHERNFVLIPLREILTNYPSILKKYNIDYHIEKNKFQNVIKIK